jgi:hypothetical protein
VCRSAILYDENDPKDRQSDNLVTRKCTQDSHELSSAGTLLVQCEVSSEEWQLKGLSTSSIRRGVLRPAQFTRERTVTEWLQPSAPILQLRLVLEARSQS